MSGLIRFLRTFLAVARVFGYWPSLYLKWRALTGGLRNNDAEKWTTKSPPVGIWMRPNGTDLSVVTQIFGDAGYSLRWCRPYRDYIEQICKSMIERGKLPLIIDAGANIGSSSIFFTLHFPDCHIFAVEPDQDNFEMLKRNTVSYPKITLFNNGVWDTKANLSIKSLEDGSWARRVEEGESGKQAVASVTIPELLAGDERLAPLIVKVDIEGAESALLRSNTEWLDHVPLLIFESHDSMWNWLGMWQGTGHAFFSALARHKREYLFRDENVYAFLHPGLGAIACYTAKMN